MALMFIDTRDQRPLPPPVHEPWGPKLRPFVPIVVAVPMLVVAPMVSPLPSYGLTVGAITLIARTAAKLMPSSNGLEDYHQ